MSATDTDAEIRRLFVEEGRSKTEVAEQVGVPEAVIEKWAERNADVELPSSSGDEPAKGNLSIIDEGLYRCSSCKDIVSLEDLIEHEEECLRGTDWSKLAG